jgi:hypothetical protein
MSFINIQLKLMSGDTAAVILPRNFTRQDFRQAVANHYGGVNVSRFYVGPEQLDLEDDDRFNAMKHLINDGVMIFVLERLCGGCFLPNTLILRADKTQIFIQNIQVGDCLLAFTNSGETVPTVVQQVFVHKVDEYLEMSVAGRPSLQVTHDHPFYIGAGRFCPLKNVNNDIGHVFVYKKGSLVKETIIRSKNVIAQNTQVYNLATAYPHTFFANGIAVHNKLGDIGVSFVDVSEVSGLQRLQWSHTAPRWWIASAGICLEGKCTNTHCEAYQQQVIMNIGFGEFDVLTGANSTTTKCPCCAKYVEPTTCAFNRCMWRWRGIKQPAPGEPPEEVSAEWRQADNAYHRFDQGISGTVVWRKLIIEAKKDY